MTEKIGERARAILERAFQRGNAKGGDRRSCFQMEEELANKLPVEERVTRFSIQSWLSSRLTQEKKEKDPKYVRARAVLETRQQLLVAAWGFDPNSMTKDQIKKRLVEEHECTPRTRNNPGGDFSPSLGKEDLLEFLYSKQEVPTPFGDVDSFLKG